MTTCPKCSHVNHAATGDPLDTCPACGLIYARFDPSAAMRERIFRARSSGDWSSIPVDQVPPEYRPVAAAAVVVVTTPMVPGRSVAQVVDVVSGECVYGVNILRDLVASVIDVTGGRNESAETVLRNGKNAAIAQLKGEAFARGADAVIGTQISINEIAGGGKSMLCVVTTGTAVRLVASSKV